MRGRDSLRRQAPLLAGALAALAVWTLFLAGGLAEGDARLRAALAEDQARFPDALVLIAVDTPSYRALPQPIPRTAWIRLVRALTAAGVRAIGLDFYLAQPGVDPEGTNLRFAEALREARATLAVGMLDRPPLDGARVARTLALASWPEGPTPALRGWILPPHGPLAGAVPVAINAIPPEGLERGVVALAEVAGRRVPALGLRMFEIGEGPGAGAPREDADRITLGSRIAYVDRDGVIQTTLRDPSSLATLSLADVLAQLQGDPPRLPPRLAAALMGRYMLVANTSPLLGEIDYSVRGEQLPTAIGQARLLADLIEGRHPRTAPGWMDGATILLFGLLLTLAGARARPALALTALATVLFGIVGGWLFAQRSGLWLGAAGPLASSTLAFSLSLATRLIGEQRERQILRGAFGAYVHPAQLERVLEAPERFLAFGGARRELTILFADVQGYTALSNRASAEEVIAFLREYLAAACAPIRGRLGRIDKIMGDGILAVFGDPIPNPDHARAGVMAALEMQEAVRALNQSRARLGRPEVSIRIGVATGPVFIGNIGSRRKLEYTVIGATVNLASRLEGKAGAGNVLVSAETRTAAADAFDFEPVPGLTLKGFPEGYCAFRARRKEEGCAPRSDAQR